MPVLMASLIAQQSLPGMAYEVIPLKIAAVVHYAVVSSLPLTASGFTGGFPWGRISDILGDFIYLIVEAQNKEPT